MKNEKKSDELAPKNQESTLPFTFLLLVCPDLSHADLRRIINIFRKILHALLDVSWELALIHGVEYEGVS